MAFAPCSSGLIFSIGVTAGLLILLMSGTGALLSYQRQLIAWSDRVPAARPPSAGPSQATAPFSVAVRNDPDAPVVVSAGADVVLLAVMVIMTRVPAASRSGADNSRSIARQARSSRGAVLVEFTRTAVAHVSAVRPHG